MESNINYPLAIIKNGDKIKLSESKKSIDLLIYKEEMLSQISNFPKTINIYKPGYKKLYQETILSATKGCDFDFLN